MMGQMKGGEENPADNSELCDSAASSSAMEAGVPWIEWFCQLEENRFFVEVEEDYIRDDFNMTGLSQYIPQYHKALDIVLDSDGEGDDSESESGRYIQAAAVQLFGLIHARYILTAIGMQAMAEKCRAKTYGVCPNSKCRDQAMMPVGLSDMPTIQNTVVYCPRCREIYHPVSPRLRVIDGAYFGRTFAPLFFMQHTQLYRSEGPLDYYVPKIYGFKVSPMCRRRSDCEIDEN